MSDLLYEDRNEYRVNVMPGGVNLIVACCLILVLNGCDEGVNDLVTPSQATQPSDSTPSFKGTTILDETLFTASITVRAGSLDKRNETSSTRRFVSKATDIKISVDEWKDTTGAAITVTLDAKATTATTVELRSSGSANLGSDFDLTVNGEALAVSTEGIVAIKIPVGEISATTILRPIRDLDEEGEETATISIATVNGVAPTDSTNSADITINDTGRLLLSTDTSQHNDFADIGGQLSLSVTADTVEIEAALFNFGTVPSSATTGYVEARTSPDLSDGAVRATPEEVSIGPLAVESDEDEVEPWKGTFSLKLSDLSASQNYYVAFVVNTVAEEDGTGGEKLDRAFADFHTDADGQVRVTCTGFTRNAIADTTDPLFKDQWSLKNTGQRSQAEAGGVAGESLRMSTTLEDGPTGNGVTVAIVDTGLEICHPDLAPNVKDGLSHNFVTSQWHGATLNDPFLPTLLEGDHGTSVAGIVAMVADNGIGGRGVAPEASLRGFNLLALGPYEHLGGEYDVDARELDSLGMSTSNPQSNDVDIFNMSYGGTDGASKLGTDKRNAFKAGVEQLRIHEGTDEPLGVIYVLASGNSFNACQTIPDLSDEKQSALFLNAELGCVSANLDPESAWPYLINVGAFSADGKRSSYSSVGANIWVVAPGGEDALEKPAVISADQMGLDRGYATEQELEELETATKNPDGDYTYIFNGTSAAAPHAAGAVAVMLSAEPNLTWRDVKHILAKTARQLQPDIRQTRVALGDKPAILQHAWITNAAGYRFHNHYGFGAIHIDNAVGMARTITPNNLGSFVQSDPFSQSPSSDIPDYDGAGITLTQTISGLPNSATIEAVQVRFQIAHPRPHDLGLTLVSPAGTPSVVNHVFNSALDDHHDDTVDWELLSNAFYGESPIGDWKLNVLDAAPDSTGRVDSWALVFFYGEHPDS